MATKSSSDTIYFSTFNTYRYDSQTLKTSHETIKAANKELKTTIGDLNGFWKGTISKKYTAQLEGYIDLINKYCECLQDGCEDLEKGHKAYTDFDNYFANKKI